MNPRPPLPMAQCPWESLSKMLDVVLVLSAKRGAEDERPKIVKRVAMDNSALLHDDVRKLRAPPVPRTYPESTDALQKFTTLLERWAPNAFRTNDADNLKELRTRLYDPSVCQYIATGWLNVLSLDFGTKCLLHQAAFSHNNALLLELLQLRATPNVPTTTDHTPLHYAISSKNDKGIQYLLRYHAKMQSNKDGDHELHLIAKHWRVGGNITRELANNVVLDLLRHGADIFAKDKKHKTPLEVANDPNKDAVVANILEQYSIVGATYTEPYRPKVPIDDPRLAHHVEAWKTYYENLSIPKLLLDEYSVRFITLAHIAELRDSTIIPFHISYMKDVGITLRDAHICILDGMCGSGFDSMSFIKNFPNGYIISNEIDEERFYYMVKNTKQLLKHSTALHRIRNGDLLHLIEKPNSQVADPLFWDVQLLYLDPTWDSAPYYDGKRTEEYDVTSTTFKVGDMLVEDVAVNAFEAKKSSDGSFAGKLQCVLIKLPPNYDRDNLLLLKSKGYRSTVHSVFVNDGDDRLSKDHWQEKQLFVAIEKGPGDVVSSSHFIYKGAHWLPPHDWERPKTWKMPANTPMVRHESVVHHESIVDHESAVPAPVPQQPAVHRESAVPAPLPQVPIIHHESAVPAPANQQHEVQNESEGPLDRFYKMPNILNFGRNAIVGAT